MPIPTTEGADAIDARAYELNRDDNTAEPHLPTLRSLRIAAPISKGNKASGHTLNLKIDSGSSFHIVNNPDFLVNKRSTDETISGVD